MQSKRKIQAAVAMSAIALYAIGGVIPAGAKASAGSAMAFGATADLLGTNLIPPTPVAKQATAGPNETDATLIGIPASPLLINGTLVARTIVGPEVPSELTVAKQTTAGPYSARAIGQIEDLSVLIQDGVPGGVLVSADALRAEAVASCSGVEDGNEANYSAASEVVDLVIGGNNALTGPLNDLVKQITDAINASPLIDVVHTELNKVTKLDGGGISVDALVLTVLQAIDGAAPGPLAKITLGHAEVGPTTCGGDLSRSDPTECNDGVDNDGDALVDTLDPGCHTDGNPLNKDSYDPTDNDERNAIVGGKALASTGLDIPTGLAAGLGIGALGLLALRRRLFV